MWAQAISFFHSESHICRSHKVIFHIYALSLVRIDTRNDPLKSI